MDRGSSYLLFLCPIILALLSLSFHSTEAQPAETLMDDIEGLIAFKALADGGNVLTSWKDGTDPCSTGWVGVECSKGTRARVTKVVLHGVGLIGQFGSNTLGRLTELRMLALSYNTFNGSFPSDLSNLSLIQFWAQNASFSGSFPNISMNSTRLTRLSLSGNKLNGSIPDLGGLQNLSTVDLSGNSFEGTFPSIYSSLNALSATKNSLKGSVSPGLVNTKLTNLDLSSNKFTGPIPDLSGMQNLNTLNLSHNSFDGPIPGLPPNLSDLNLSSNSLNGSVPPDLVNEYGANAFTGNPALCVSTAQNPCVGTVGAASPGSPAPAPADPKSSGLGTRNEVFIAVGALVLCSVIVLCFARYFSKRDTKGGTMKLPEKNGDNGAGVGLSSTAGDSDRSKLSFIEDSQQGYDLEDLLRASAEMLGKGSFGTAYKAVMESGMIVAVKRLRDVKELRRAEFSQHMELLGKLKHPNLVPLRAYYYAREEKLLIYDFMPNGSLFSLLHGSRGPARTPLEWHARLSIAQGIANGLTYLHQECGYKIPHGNLKSSNVLMGKNFEVCISDFGLVPLMPSQIAAQRMAGYRAPEYHQTKKITYKADVYSFGVLLLELLTGRQPSQSINDNGLDLPKWVQSVVREEWTGEVFDLELKAYLHGEEEMVNLLQIAMSCVEPRPELRPQMAAIVGMLEGIRRGDNVLDSESFQSHSTDGDYSSKDLPLTI